MGVVSEGSEVAGSGNEVAGSGNGSVVEGGGAVVVSGSSEAGGGNDKSISADGSGASGGGLVDSGCELEEAASGFLSFLLAVAALTDDAAYVELIADGHHVHPAVWELIRRAKPVDRLILVSDALSLSGTGPGRTRVGATDVEVLEDRAIVAGTTTLAGSVMALDSMLRNLVRSGAPLPAAARAASGNPAALLGVDDRGRIAVGLRADLVEMDDALVVRRVMLGGAWVA